MKDNGLAHPGRSVDFLSRLHDGELAPAERVRFEAHRAHCAECRRAAIEFEDAITLFRSTRSTPPRSDLAARILRKVQTTNRPRTPFPLRFRMDLGWAALLLTGLFALLIVVRQKAVFPPTPGAPPPAAAKPDPQTAAASKEEPAQAPAAVARPQQKARLEESKRAPAPLANRAAPPAVADEVGASARDNERLQSRERDDAPEESRDTRRAAAAAPEAAGAGGEGELSARAAAAAVPLHMTVTEIDGFGAPPDLVSGVRIELPGTERGRSYVIDVDSQGTVRQVYPAASRDSDGFGARSKKQVSKMEAVAPPPLFRLRFEPGNRPRKLLVRID